RWKTGAPWSDTAPSRNAGLPGNPIFRARATSRSPSTASATSAATTTPPRGRPSTSGRWVRLRSRRYAATRPPRRRPASTRSTNRSYPSATISASFPRPAPCRVPATWAVDSLRLRSHHRGTGLYSRPAPLRADLGRVVADLYRMPDLLPTATPRSARRGPIIVHVYEQILVTSTSQISTLLDHADPPPTATLAVSGQRVPAALLLWGKPPDGASVAGVAYPSRAWHSRALVTMWGPAAALTPRKHTDYRRVPRVRLRRDRGRWPTLPPRYPGAGPEWVAVHRHLDYLGL